MSETILIRSARVLTLTGDSPRRGSAMGELGVIEGGDVLVRDGIIDRVGAGLDAPAGARTIEADGRVLMPGFVDCHTHACWAGDRLDEWELKQRGVSYLEILHRGGGIMSTVRSVRAASEDALVERLAERLEWMLREGTTTVEIKSGYGLDTATELKMLRAITRAGRDWAGTVVPTACIGHAIDPEAGDAGAFVERTIRETLSAVHEAFPGVTIDAYCEQGAWSLADTVRLFEAALEHGHPVRVHADQFHALGMVEEAVRLGAVSVDHLEATESASLVNLARSGTFGVMLPCSGFHLDGRYANGRAFVDAGGALAIATNCNPGSAPCASVPMAVALAVRNLRLTAAEAIAAVTTNAASLLGFTDRGRIEPGARADLVLLRWRDERQLGFEFGGSPADLVLCNGRIVTGGGVG